MFKIQKAFNTVFGECVSFDGDILKPLINMASLLFRKSVNRAICVTIAILSGINNMLYLNYVMSYPSMQEIMKFLPIQMLIFSAMCGYSYVIVKFDANRKVIETMKHSLKPISEGNGKTARKIMRKAKFIHTFMIIYLTCTLFFSLPWHDASEEFHFILMYINRHFGRVMILRVAYYLCLIHACCVMTTVHSYWVYYIFHINFQLRILKENIEALMRKSDTFYKDAYQREVYEKLKECIRHHQGIKRCHTAFNQSIFWGLLFYECVGIALQTVTIIFILYRIKPEADLKVMVIYLITNFSLWGYCSFGQLYQNEFELLYSSLNNLPWYNWSIKNRKLLHIFMVNTQNVPVIKSVSTLKVSNELLTVTYKSIYTLLTFFYTVTQKK